MAAAQGEQAEVLEQKLQQDADDDEQGDDLAEGEETEEGGGESEGDERAVRESVAGMERVEGAKEVAVACGGPGNAGVAEQEREDAGKGAPEDERGEDAGGGGTEGDAGEVGDEGDASGGVGCGERAGAERGQQGEVHGEIERGDDGEREQDGSGDGALRMAHFRAEEADVVVAPVVVAGDERGLSERGQESERGPAEQRGERGRGMESRRDGCTRGDDADNGDEHAEEEDPGHARNGGEVAVKQCRDQQAGRGCDEAGGVKERQAGDGRGKCGPEPDGEGGHTEAAGGDGKRRGEAELPDVKKRDPATGAARVIDLAQKGVRATGVREGGTKFRPDQTVTESDDGAEQPGPGGEASAGRGKDDGKRDEGADADHLHHVQRDGRGKAETTSQCAVGAMSGRGVRRVRRVGGLGHDCDCGAAGGCTDCTLAMR